ncbi:MAG TPA: DUF2889 domain-containing protein [Stellaceae bacterium]|nr:DUF2889 domain-containing protein [Stellaceae bacterium]
MPLPEAAPRELIHTRRIEGHGYRRQDGLWDIEGRLTDGKTYAFKNEYRGEVKAGEFIHQMWLRLTVDDTLTIQAVEAATDNSPFAICPAILPSFQRLKGLRIAKGFNAKVFELFGGVEGCTHHVELIGRLATVAFQTVFPYRNRKAAAEGRTPDSSRRPRLLNTCHAFAENGEIAKKLWPATEESKPG